MTEPSKLTRAAAAYAAGQPRQGERLFRDAYLEIRPLVRSVVEAHLTGPEDRDDAEMRAMTGIWESVRAGVEPGIERRAAFAAIDVFRQNMRARVDRREDLDENLPEREPDDELRADLLAPYAPDLWRDIHDLAQAGWGQREIALKLGVSPSRLRAVAVEIRADYHLRRSVTT